jgi:cytochrome c oxidase assembly factor CtaG
VTAVPIVPPPAAAGSLHLGEFLPPVVIMGAYLGAYGARARTLRRTGRPVARWRICCFVAGVAIVALVQLPPLDDLADRVLIAHMAQHLMIGDIASVLVVIGLTGPVLQPLLHLRAGRAMRRLTHPVVALALWALANYIWRVPLFYQAAVRYDLLHALEHASYLWFGMLLWIALLGPMPKPAWFSNWAKLGYVAAVRFLGAVLANVFIWSETLFYPVYRATDAHEGLNPLSDQNVSGALMMIEQMILTVLLLGWLFMRLARQDAERQELVDYALDHGLDLSDERAARAAAAGTAARLRERLEHEALRPPGAPAGTPAPPPPGG